jgi:ribonuclease E/ribonuclease G
MRSRNYFLLFVALFFFASFFFEASFSAILSCSVLDETAGATIIDVDGGGMAVMEANRLALPVMVEQIALRGLAGHILLDVIPTNDKPSQSALVDELRQLLEDDPAEIIGATRLGLIEVTRERRQPSLAEWFYRPPEPRRTAASLALEALQAVLREALACPGAILSLRAAPDIVHYLDRRPDLLAEIKDRLGRALPLIARPDLTGFEVSQNQ